MRHHRGRRGCGPGCGPGNGGYGQGQATYGSGNGGYGPGQAGYEQAQGKNSRRSTGLYRSRNGMILGVFRGLADYLDVPVFWLRAAGVLLCLFTGFWPVLALYIIAGLLIRLQPVVPFNGPEDRAFYDSYASPGKNARSDAVARLKRKFDNLNRRIQRMEHIVTSKDFDWKRRFTE